MTLPPAPLIIMSAPNGARRQKSDHPGLPVTPGEIAACAEEIVAAGASMLHLHVRDDRGGHSLDVGRYQAAIAAVREAVGTDIIIQATSEAVGKYSRDQQMAMVKELKPEAVSLALRELVPGDAQRDEFSRFVDWMRQEHIFPQYILYDEDDYHRFESCRRQGLFQTDQPFTLFVLGRYQEGASDDGAEDRLRHCTEEAQFPWAVCGFGINEINAVSHAAAHNGHIRVGFENNIWRRPGQLLSNNAEMIRHCASAGQAAGRQIATAQDVRNLFNLRE